jgi:hypothetical protein
MQDPVRTPLEQPQTDNSKGYVENDGRTFAHLNEKKKKWEYLGEKEVKHRINEYSKRVELHKENVKELENLKAESDELDTASNVLKNNESWLTYWKDAFEQMKERQK